MQNSETQSNESTTNSNSAATDQTKAIADAIAQMKAATSAIYQAFGSMGSASSEVAKFKVLEGKAKAQALGAKAELSIIEKPLVSVGIAFAAGWLVSRLSK